MRLHDIAKKCFFCLCFFILLAGGCSSKSDIKKTTDETVTHVASDDLADNDTAEKRLLEGIKIVEGFNSKQSCRLIIAASSQPTYTVFKLSKPDRLIVDLPDFIPGAVKENMVVQNNVISTITSKQIEDTDRNFLRVQVDLTGDVKYSATNENNTIYIDIDLVASAAAMEKVPSSQNKTNITTDKVQNKKAGHKELNGIREIIVDPESIISIVADGEIEKYITNTLQKPNRLVIDMPKTALKIKKNIEGIKSTFVENIRIGQNNKTARIVIDFRGDILPPYRLTQEDNVLNVHFKDVAVQEKASDKQKKKENIAAAQEPDEEKKTAEKSKGAESEAVEGVKDDQAAGEAYTGEKISFDFKDADIKNVLRLISDISGLNIIVGDRVQGKVTMKIENIAWDEALDIILENNGLGKIDSKNVVRIDTSEQIKKINEEKLQAKKSQEQVEDTIIKSFNVSYAKASDLANFIKSMNMLTQGRGSITSFELTNKLTVHDIPAVVKRIEDVLKEQDIPTRQVMIEAKVVQSSPNYVKELGIRWGGSYQGHKDGGLAAGGADIPITGGLSNNSVVDLLSAANGSIGFGYIKDKYNLDVKLTALENEDKLKILSNPRVLSLDNKDSEIKQGVALPYLKLNENGVSTTEFKEAVLEMKVTPKITSANTITLKVEVKKDQKSAQTGVNNEPGIDVREIKTNLLVESGRTVVIGGIYENTKSSNIKKVPFLADIPYIGTVFKSKKVEDTLTELLVFLTVTIVESPGAVAQEKNDIKG